MTECTSLPASECGTTRVIRQAMAEIRHGPAVARANLSARQAKEQDLLTSGIFGLPGSTSSSSAVLQSFLASRLQARTASLGSTLYNLTWKSRVTPAGRSIFALRASVRRTSGKGSGGSLSGWVTTTTRDWKDTPGMATERPDGRSRLDQLSRQAALAGWSTPTSNNGTGAGTQGREG